MVRPLIIIIFIINIKFKDNIIMIRLLKLYGLFLNLIMGNSFYFLLSIVFSVNYYFFTKFLAFLLYEGNKVSRLYVGKILSSFYLMIELIFFSLLFLKNFIKKIVFIIKLWNYTISLFNKVRLLFRLTWRVPKKFINKLYYLLIYFYSYSIYFFQSTVDTLLRYIDAFLELYIYSFKSTHKDTLDEQIIPLEDYWSTEKHIIPYDYSFFVDYEPFYHPSLWISSELDNLRPLTESQIDEFEPHRMNYEGWKIFRVGETLPNNERFLYTNSLEDPNEDKTDYVFSFFDPDLSRSYSKLAQADVVYSYNIGEKFIEDYYVNRYWQLDLSRTPIDEDDGFTIPFNTKAGNRKNKFFRGDAYSVDFRDFKEFTTFYYQNAWDLNQRTSDFWHALPLNFLEKIDFINSNTDYKVKERNSFFDINELMYIYTDFLEDKVGDSLYLLGLSPTLSEELHRDYKTYLTLNEYYLMTINTTYPSYRASLSHANISKFRSLFNMFFGVYRLRIRKQSDIYSSQNFFSYTDSKDIGHRSFDKAYYLNPLIETTRRRFKYNKSNRYVFNQRFDKGFQRNIGYDDSFIRFFLNFGYAPNKVKSVLYDFNKLGYNFNQKNTFSNKKIPISWGMAYSESSYENTFGSSVVSNQLYSDGISNYNFEYARFHSYIRRPYRIRFVDQDAYEGFPHTVTFLDRLKARRYLAQLQSYSNNIFAKFQIEVPRFTFIRWVNIFYDESDIDITDHSIPKVLSNFSDKAEYFLYELKDRSNLLDSKLSSFFFKIKFFWFKLENLFVFKVFLRLLKLLFSKLYIIFLNTKINSNLFLANLVTLFTKIDNFRDDYKGKKFFTLIIYARASPLYVLMYIYYLAGKCSKIILPFLIFLFVLSLLVTSSGYLDLTGFFIDYFAYLFYSFLNTFFFIYYLCIDIFNLDVLYTYFILYKEATIINNIESTNFLAWHEYVYMAFAGIVGLFFSIFMYPATFLVGLLVNELSDLKYFIYPQTLFDLGFVPDLVVHYLVGVILSGFYFCLWLVKFLALQHILELVTLSDTEILFNVNLFYYNLKYYWLYYTRFIAENYIFYDFVLVYFGRLFFDFCTLFNLYYLMFFINIKEFIFIHLDYLLGFVVGFFSIIITSIYTLFLMSYTFLIYFFYLLDFFILPVNYFSYFVYLLLSWAEEEVFVLFFFELSEFKLSDFFYIFESLDRFFFLGLPGYFISLFFFILGFAADLFLSLFGVNVSNIYIYLVEVGPNLLNIINNYFISFYIQEYHKPYYDLISDYNNYLQVSDFNFILFYYIFAISFIKILGLQKFVFDTKDLKDLSDLSYCWSMLQKDEKFWSQIPADLRNLRLLSIYDVMYVHTYLFSKFLSIGEEDAASHNDYSSVFADKPIRRMRELYPGYQHPHKEINRGNYYAFEPYYWPLTIEFYYNTWEFEEGRAFTELTTNINKHPSEVGTPNFNLGYALSKPGYIKEDETYSVTEFEEINNGFEFPVKKESPHLNKWFMSIYDQTIDFSFDELAHMSNRPLFQERGDDVDDEEEEEDTITQQVAYVMKDLLEEEQSFYYTELELVTNLPNDASSEFNTSEVVYNTISDYISNHMRGFFNYFENKGFNYSDIINNDFKDFLIDLPYNPNTDRTKTFSLESEEVWGHYEYSQHVRYTNLSYSLSRRLLDDPLLLLDDRFYNIYVGTASKIFGRDLDLVYVHGFHNKYSLGDSYVLAFLFVIFPVRCWVIYKKESTKAYYLDNTEFFFEHTLLLRHFAMWRGLEGTWYNAFEDGFFGFHQAEDDIKDEFDQFEDFHDPTDDLESWRFNFFNAYIHGTRKKFRWQVLNALSQSTEDYTFPWNFDEGYNYYWRRWRTHGMEDEKYEYYRFVPSRLRYFAWTQYHYDWKWRMFFEKYVNEMFNTRIYFLKRFHYGAFLHTYYKNYVRYNMTGFELGRAYQYRVDDFIHQANSAVRERIWMVNENTWEFVDHAHLEYHFLFSIFSEGFLFDELPSTHTQNLTIWPGIGSVISVDHDNISSLPQDRLTTRYNQDDAFWADEDDVFIQSEELWNVYIHPDFLASFFFSILRFFAHSGLLDIVLTVLVYMSLYRPRHDQSLDLITSYYSSLKNYEEFEDAYYSSVILGDEPAYFFTLLGKLIYDFIYMFFYQIPVDVGKPLLAFVILPVLFFIFYVAFFFGLNSIFLLFSKLLYLIKKFRYLTHYILIHQSFFIEHFWHSWRKYDIAQHWNISQGAVSASLSMTLADYFAYLIYFYLWDEDEWHPEDENSREDIVYKFDVPVSISGPPYDIEEMWRFPEVSQVPFDWIVKPYFRLRTYIYKLQAYVPDFFLDFYKNRFRLFFLEGQYIKFFKFNLDRPLFMSWNVWLKFPTNFGPYVYGVYIFFFELIYNLFPHLVGLLNLFFIYSVSVNNGITDYFSFINIINCYSFVFSFVFNYSWFFLSDYLYYFLNSFNCLVFIFSPGITFDFNDFRFLLNIALLLFDLVFNFSKDVFNYLLLHFTVLNVYMEFYLTFFANLINFIPMFVLVFIIITLIKLLFFYLSFYLKKFNGFLSYLNKFICGCILLYLFLFIWLSFWNLVDMKNFSEEMYINNVFILNYILFFSDELASFFNFWTFITDLKIYFYLSYVYDTLGLYTSLIYNYLSEFPTLLDLVKIYLFCNENLNLVVFFLLDYFSFFFVTLFYFFESIFEFFRVMDFIAWLKDIFS